MSTSNRTKLFLDICAFAAFLIAMDPRSSGIAIHEWLTLALAATVVVHLLLNWSWIVEVTRRFFIKSTNGARINYVLNWLLFFDGVLMMLSGIMISEAVVPTLGLSISPNFTWRGLHELSTNMALLLMGLHIALHWTWVISTVKRLFTNRKPQVAVGVSMVGKDVQA